MTAARVLDRIVTAAALVCPLFLTHGRGLAEASIDVAAIGLLLRSVAAGDWNWLRRPWVGIAALWWGWLCICSLPFGPFGTGGWSGLIQAVATVRFPLFAASLQHVALRDPEPRRAMRWLIAACCLYIAGQMLLQALTGHNLFGVPRFGDGTLTGPYDKPRAAAPLSRLLLPVTLAASVWIGTRRPARAGPGRVALLAGLASLPTLCGLAVMVLAGQRMPLLLELLGLLVAGLLLRRLRPVLLGVLLAAPVLVAASAIVSPHSFGHLVLLFERQMRHFGQSPYGLIYTRAISIAASNPLTGLGFDGFRNGCADPAYFHDWPPWSDAAGFGDGGGAAICVQHAHNHALQALTDAGVPGLLLFAAMVAAWLWALGRGLWWPETGAAGVVVAKAGVTKAGVAGVGAAGYGATGSGATGPGLSGSGTTGLGAAGPGLTRAGLTGPSATGSGVGRPGAAGVAASEVGVAWRVGLFAAVFVHEWPLASASAFTNLPLGGWFFLLLGAGLAEAYIEPRSIQPWRHPHHA